MLMFMGERITRKELDSIADIIKQGPYEGYPEHRNRLFLGAAGLRLAKVGTNIPDGLWHIANHVNRQGKTKGLDPEVPDSGMSMVDPKLIARWRSAGLSIDQYGRPIHPDAEPLLADPRIGLPTGTGFFYKYGPNETVDPVTYRGELPEFLLIRREKGRRWALPGGFVDRKDKSAQKAARRELGEETGLTEVGGVDEVILNKRSVGLRDTIHAWTENTVVLIHGNQEYLYDTEPVAQDDAIDVGWFTREGMDSLEMFDAHAQYIEKAYDEIHRKHH